MGGEGGTYLCPQCSARHVEIPTQCPLCDLKLISSAELTKTYHHLFPVPGFVEARAIVYSPPTQPAAAYAAYGLGTALPAPEIDEAAAASSAEAGKCFACRDALPVVTTDGSDLSVGFECPACRERFCAPCDDHVHETLHTCPGCTSRHETRAKDTAVRAV